MSDAWEIFVRGISKSRLETERFGRTRTLNVAKNSVAREAFNTPAHQLLVEQQHFRGVVWRGAIERAQAMDRVAVLETWWADLDRPDKPVVPRTPRAPRKPSLSVPKPPPAPTPIKAPQFSARHLEIAMAAMDAPKTKPVHKYAA